MADKNYNLVRGMKDIRNEEAEIFDFIIDRAIKISKKYNFQHLTTPIVEFSSLFERNLGKESDIIHKEIYRFEDAGGNILALRPEMTAGVCRFIIENGLFYGPFPHKYFSFGSVFRYDRPQKGRYRQFNQLNFEIFGLKDMAEEIKVYLKMIYELLNELEINNIKIKINYLGSIEERKKFTTKLKEYLLSYKDQLSNDSKRRLETNILRILDTKDESDKKILENAPKIMDYLTEEHKNFLYSFDKEYEIDNNLVRGLDYYSGFVFEFVTDKIGATQNSICGGGEYNNLIFDMSNKQLNAFGFALGIERLMELIDINNVPKQPKLYLHLTEKSKFVENCRNEFNYQYKEDFVKGLKYANQINADFLIFEKDNQLIEKNLQTGEQKILNKTM